MTSAPKSFGLECCARSPRAAWRPLRDGAPGDPDAEHILLRAQLVLAASIGIAVLRSSAGLDPLARATEEELLVPLRELVETLLSTS